VVVELELLVVEKRSNVVAVVVVDVAVVSVEDVVLGFVGGVTASSVPARSTSEDDGGESIAGAGESSPSDAVADQMNPPRNATTPAMTAAIAVLRPFMSPVDR
jgi:hypothetical protein